MFWRVVVAFLHFVINSSDIVVSKQQSVLFILTLSKLIIVDWLRLALWSVWTFLSTEKPLSAFAFEQGILKSPDINMKSLENLSSPINVLIFPTFHQKGPAETHFIWPTALYCWGVGRSIGERVKSVNSSSRHRSNSGSSNPSWGNGFCQPYHCSWWKRTNFWDREYSDSSSECHQKEISSTFFWIVSK